MVVEGCRKIGEDAIESKRTKKEVMRAEVFSDAVVAVLRGGRVRV